MLDLWLSTIVFWIFQFRVYRFIQKFNFDRSSTECFLYCRFVPCGNLNATLLRSVLTALWCATIIFQKLRLSNGEQLNEMCRIQLFHIEIMLKCKFPVNGAKSFLFQHNSIIFVGSINFQLPRSENELWWGVPGQVLLSAVTSIITHFPPPSVCYWSTIFGK